MQKIDEKNLVSIIIPVYNVEKYIERCIQSVQNQDYTNIEIIVVNDGSTDITGSICDSMACNDDRIRVIHKHNEGVSIARNTGIENARGEWIMFVDGDDWIEKVAVSVLMNKAKNSEADCIIGSYYWDINGKSQKASSENGGTISIDLKEKRNQIIAACMLKPDMTKGLFSDELLSLPKLAGPIAKLYKKTDLIKYHIDFPEGLKDGEDSIFNIRYFKNIQSIMFTNIPIYHYVIRSGSATTTDIKTKATNGIELFKALKKELDEWKEDKVVCECYAIALILKLEEIAQFCGMDNSNIGFIQKIKILEKFKKEVDFIIGKRGIHISKIRSARERIILFLLKNNCLLLVMIICKLYYIIFPQKNRYGTF